MAAGNSVADPWKERIQKRETNYTSLEHRRKEETNSPGRTVNMPRSVCKHVQGGSCAIFSGVSREMEKEVKRGENGLLNRPLFDTPA